MTVASVPASIPRSSTTSLRRNPAAAWRHLDLVLMAAVAAVSSLGTLMVYAATRGPGEGQAFDSTYLKKQALFVGLGALALVVSVVVDYRIYRDFAPILYCIGIAMLVLVVSPIGTTSKGTQAW